MLCWIKIAKSVSDWPFESEGTSEFALTLAKILFIAASVLVLTSIAFSIAEKKQISFSRLKISTSEKTKEPKKEIKTSDSKFVESLNKSNLKIRE